MVDSDRGAGPGHRERTVARPGGAAPAQQISAVPPPPAGRAGAGRRAGKLADLDGPLTLPDLSPACRPVPPPRPRAYRAWRRSAGPGERHPAEASATVRGEGWRG